MSTESIYI